MNTRETSRSAAAPGKQQTTRRVFLIETGTLAAGAAALAWPRALRAAGANERITLGIIGPGGMGSSLLQSFAGMADVAIAVVCDPDAKRLEAAAQLGERISGKRPQAVKDLRQVLDDKDVDAVVIATPDHWHAPAAILACDAGKHVYVEKPCSHNIREGRLMVEAARRNKRVVQVGTQSRSAEHVHARHATAARGRHRRRAGRQGLEQPAARQHRPRHSQRAAAADLDYDLWVGPAPMVPYQSNLLPGIWRWWYDFGCGDMGNDGVHDIDIARWGLGVDDAPDRIAALGGKYFFDDDQQFPDTQYVVFEYDQSGAAQASSSSSSSGSGRPTCRKATRTATPSTAPRAC